MSWISAAHAVFVTYPHPRGPSIEDEVEWLPVAANENLSEDLDFEEVM